MPKQCCKDTWNKIPDDEPVFIIRGKDALAPSTMRAWISMAEKNGVDEDKIRRVTEHLNDVLHFQAKNPDKVKIPD